MIGWSTYGGTFSTNSQNVGIFTDYARAATNDSIYKLWGNEFQNNKYKKLLNASDKPWRLWQHPTYNWNWPFSAWQNDGGMGTTGTLESQ